MGDRSSSLYRPGSCRPQPRVPRRQRPGRPPPRSWFLDAYRRAFRQQFLRWDLSMLGVATRPTGAPREFAADCRRSRRHVSAATTGARFRRVEDRSRSTAPAGGAAGTRPRAHHPRPGWLRQDHLGSLDLPSTHRSTGRLPARPGPTRAGTAVAEGSRQEAPPHPLPRGEDQRAGRGRLRGGAAACAAVHVRPTVGPACRRLGRARPTGRAGARGTSGPAGGIPAPTGRRHQPPLRRGQAEPHRGVRGAGHAAALRPGDGGPRRSLLPPLPRG